MEHQELDDILEQVKETIESAPEDVRKEIFAESLRSIWGDDTPQAMHVIEFTKGNYLRGAIKEEDKEKAYLTRSLHEWLYQHVLETGASVKAAMELASNTFEVTLEFLEEARLNKHHMGRMKEVVTVFDDHEVQKAMINKGLMSKKELYNHRTPNAQLNRVRKGVKLYKLLKELQEKVEAHEDRINHIDVKVELLNQHVHNPDDLKDSGMETYTKVQVCKNRNFTQKKTAETLGIGIATVKRHWKEKI